MSESPSESCVAIWRGEGVYPESDLGAGQLAGADVPHPGVAAVLRLAGLDDAGAGTPRWNPLGGWVKPGDRVLVKPNWVLDRHEREGELGIQTAFDALVTHTSVLRGLVDLVQVALEGRGQIVVADAPLQACDFSALRRRAGIDGLVESYRNARAWKGGPPAVVPVVRDMRLETASRTVRARGLPQVLTKSRSDASGAHAIVDLGPRSLLEPISAESDRFRVTCYDPRPMSEAHGPGVHRYCVGREVLDADVVINVPKLKTHRKAGLTAALKNLIGINGHKSFLPHHRRGSLADGGDEFLSADLVKDLRSRVLDIVNSDGRSSILRRGAAVAGLGLAALDRAVRPDGTESGSWYGNDTLWRTCIDLNRILLWARADGSFAPPSEGPVRRVLHLVDGVVAGEGDGPLEPEPKPAGLLLFGRSAAYVDLAAALVMGLRWTTVSTLVGAFEPEMELPVVGGAPTDLELRTASASWRESAARCVRDGRPLPGHLAFAPPPGWEGVLDAPDAAGSTLPQERFARPTGTLWSAQP